MDIHMEYIIIVSMNFSTINLIQEQQQKIIKWKQ